MGRGSQLLNHPKSAGRAAPAPSSPLRPHSARHDSTQLNKPAPARCARAGSNRAIEAVAEPLPHAFQRCDLGHELRPGRRALSAGAHAPI